MRFVVDQQLPPALVGWLRARGHDAEHVREIGMREAADRDIWRHAESESAVVITKDEDFVRLRNVAGAGPVVIWLRIGNVTTSALLTWLDAHWLRIEKALKAGLGVVEVR
jgi:Uncharacterized protein conserved in bacteria